MSILSYFPYPELRKKQDTILEMLEELYPSYNYFMIEAPTGFGKSAVAETLAKWIQGKYGIYTHFLVGDKFLQEQYLRDFEDIALVKGRGNFNCPFSPIRELPCDRAPCTIIEGFGCPHKPRQERIEGYEGRSMPVFDEHGVLYDWSSVDALGAIHCPYWDQKDAGIRSDLTIHNYHYFLYEQNYAKSFARRELGIFDEAHIIENILMGFIQKNILLRTLNNIWAERYPNQRYHFEIPYLNDIEDWKQWLINTNVELETLEIYYKELVQEVKDDNSRASELSPKFKRYADMVKRIEETIEFIADDPNNWVWNREMDRVTFKPVVIKDFSSLLFKFVNKKVLMSATILDYKKLSRYLGIDPTKVKFLRINESSFPVENRLIYQDYQGKATRKTMDKYLPKMLARIDDYIIPAKGHNKGVIHTHTHKIAEYIMLNSKHSRIMISNTGTKRKRQEVFQDFFDSDAPKVMVSPSMNLGVDLYDDRCRFQVICKVPYPNLGDPQIRKRMEIDPDWYDYQTLMTLIQTYGRGCRSITDWCETYILDSMFVWLVSKNKDIIPRWFMEALRKVDKKIYKS